MLTAFLFILLQRVDVRITRTDKLTVKINFTLLAIILSEADINTKHIKGLFKLLKNRKGILRSTKYLIAKSELSALKIPFHSSFSPNGSISFDLIFHISLLQLIISALILLYYIVKNKVKRVIKNV